MPLAIIVGGAVLVTLKIIDWAHPARLFGSAVALGSDASCRQPHGRTRTLVGRKPASTFAGRRLTLRGILHADRPSDFAFFSEWPCHIRAVGRALFDVGSLLHTLPRWCRGGGLIGQRMRPLD